MLRISKHQAALLHLAAQGLLRAPRRRARRKDVREAIARMHVLQIDTIHVVARSPYLVLFSRLGAYEPRWLGQLLARGEIFECWSHEACFAPIEDYPLHRDTHAHSQHWAFRHARRVHAAHGDAMQRLLAHVADAGPVKSADFARSEGSGGGGGWWGWKVEKRFLEAWFALGELMIARRESFQRVYDLRERVLARAPADALVSMPRAQVERERVLRAVHALGVTQARWIADYFRSGARIDDAALAPYLARGELLRVDVGGWDAPGYLHPAHAALLARAMRGALRATHTTLLSPFDPVVWHRARASAMFGFDYKLECYTPAAKRRYGYYVLPILRRGRIVGRLDAKAQREDRVFEVRVLYLEDGVDAGDEALAADLAKALLECAAWHETPRVRVVRCSPAAFLKSLRNALREAQR